MSKRALVMSGGGAKGAFQLGAVDYLVNDRRLDFDVIAGVSVGALNAALLAHGRGYDGLRQRLEDLKQLWFGLRGNDDVYRKRFLGEVLVFVTQSSMYDPAPIREKMDRHVNPDQLKASGKEFRAGAVSLESGDYVTITQSTPDVAAWALASASMPLAFPPVRVSGQHLLDGGLRNVTPLKDAFAALKLSPEAPGDPDEMFILLASPPGVESRAGARWSNGRDIGLRSVELLVNEVFREDISHALAVNSSARSYVELRALLQQRGQLDDAAKRVLERLPFKPPAYRPVRLWGVVPDREFTGALEFDPRRIREAFEAGRAAAARPLDEDALRALLDGASS